MRMFVKTRLVIANACNKSFSALLCLHLPSILVRFERFGIDEDWEIVECKGGRFVNEVWL